MRALPAGTIFRSGTMGVFPIDSTTLVGILIADSVLSGLPGFATQPLLWAASPAPAGLCRRDP